MCLRWLCLNLGGDYLDLRVFLLAMTAVTVGLVELVVGGVLPIIAGDVDVSVATAVHFLPFFALVYAIGGPIFFSLRANMDSKILFFITLFIFFLGNIFTYFSPTFELVMLACVLMAAS